MSDGNRCCRRRERERACCGLMTKGFSAVPQVPGVVDERMAETEASLLCMWIGGGLVIKFAHPVRDRQSNGSKRLDLDRMNRLAKTWE
jgi:hypothetical protein